MIVKVEAKVIAEIRNALQIIMGNAESITRESVLLIGDKPDRIIKQVKRIDSLLPPVKFEGGK